MDPLKSLSLSTSILVLASLTLLIRVGLALQAAGLCRAKNAAAAMLRSAIEMAVAGLAFWALGAALLFAETNPVISLRLNFLFLIKPDFDLFELARLLFYLSLTLIAVGPISMALAERARMLPICCASLLLAGFIVPLCGYWAWSSHGWLNQLQFKDAAGASVLHMSGGLCAAVGAVIVGPRTGKYNTDGSSNFIPGHSMPLAGAAIMLIFAAWIPYVIGASILHLAHAGVGAINVILAACAAAVISYGTSRIRYGKPDVMLTFVGMFGGLVAITASSGLVNPLSAVAIGGIAGLIVPWVTVQIDMVWKIDDPGGTLGASIAGGAWGTIAVSVFMPGTAIFRLRQLGVQLLGLVAIAALALAASIVLFLVLKSLANLRVSEADEYDGLDLAEHDLNAYPDFQQTMIKSYHLREA